MTIFCRYDTVNNEPHGKGKKNALCATPTARLVRGGKTNMYAIFENGSKQYKVCEGDLLKVEKLNAKVGDTVQFPVVLASDGSSVKVGDEVKNLTVSCEVVSQGKEKKIIIFTYKPKKNVRKKQGHRQPYTQLKVTAIGAPAAKKAATKKPEAKAKAE